MAGERSRWRDEAMWQERIQDDRATLRDRLTEQEITALDGIVELFEGDPDFILRFLVVYGSRATGQNMPSSDLDLWIEATIPRERPFRFGGFDAMMLPGGALLTALHEGQDFARDVWLVGLVWADSDGWFRDIVIAADELPRQ